MNILITGGAGFIGSHLCELLVSLDHDVTVLDDLSSGNINNLSSCIDSIKFKNIKIENFNFDELKDIDSVVHLAAQTSVPLSIKNFKKSSSSNLLGTIKVIDFCVSNNISLIYASSAAVYGNLNEGNDNIGKVDLLSPYAADKFAMECYGNVAYKLYGLSNIGLRFFNVYGPRQDPTNAYSGVISIFCDRLLKNKDITIYGGYQTRDFIFVKDVVNVIYQSILKASNEILCDQINTLTGKSITIDTIADILIKATKADVNKIYDDLPDGDPSHSNGTSIKIKNLLNININDMSTIEYGLSATLESMKK